MEGICSSPFAVGVRHREASTEVSRSQLAAKPPLLLAGLGCWGQRVIPTIRGSYRITMVRIGRDAKNQLIPTGLPWMGTPFTRPGGSYPTALPGEAHHGQSQNWNERKTKLITEVQHLKQCTKCWGSFPEQGSSQLINTFSQNLGEKYFLKELYYE